LNKLARLRITNRSDGHRRYQSMPSITRRVALRNLPARGQLGLIISICSQSFCALISLPCDDVTPCVPEVIPMTSSRVTSEVIPLVLRHLLVCCVTSCLSR